MTPSNNNVRGVKPYPEVERLIKKCAFKGFKRLIAARCSVQLDDVIGEMNLSYVRAANAFDPQKGVEFSTYLVKTIWQNFNRWAKALVEERHVSLDTAGGTGEEDESIHEMVASEEPTPEELMERGQCRGRILNRVSAVTRKVIELLEAPPAALVHELHALQARSQVGRQHGLVAAAPQNVSVALITKALGLSVTEKRQVHEEINFVTKEFSQQ